jgi:hypothetical protein
MENENHKRKNDLMKSIMSNPKLARSFKDAISAPIGSTKREQAKSVLSIMKKVGGLRNDGMGGPLDGGMLNIGNQSSSTLNTSPTSYYIFPSAPKLKSTAGLNLTLPSSTPTNSGLTGTGSQTASAPKVNNNLFSINNSSFALPKTPVDYGLSGLTLPSTQGNSYSSGLISNGKPVIVTSPAPVQTQTPQNSQSSDTALTPGQFSGSTNAPSAPTDSNSIKQLQTQLNAQNAGKAGWVPLVVDGKMGPKTLAAQSFVPGSTSGSSTSGGSTSSGSKTGGATRSFDPVTGKEVYGGSAADIKADATKAIAEGTGPGFFAMNEANAKFGGSLDQYLNNLDEKLKKDFNLEPLELQLSNLKAESTNFIPTLTSYMEGKDKYSKAIDKMIDDAEGQLLSTNMADPFTANQYNNYMTYLYTLKGRQSQRYGTYLNAAVSDFNADVEKTQSNYDNVYKRYTDALTRQGTIAQNEYNTLYTSMADLYTNLENAPIKRLNLQILQQQKDANDLSILQNGLTSGSVYPDYYKDIKTFSENISDKDGNFVAEKIGAGGLSGLFSEAVSLSGQPEKAMAMAKAINLAMGTSLANSTDKMAELNKFKTLVSDLSGVEGGAELASMITPSLNKASYTLVSDYVLQNLPTIKKAANQLVSGTSPWFSKNKKPGLQDESGWMNDYKNINQGVLTDLFNTAKINMTPGSAYEKDPSTFVSTLFSGSDDKSIANNLTSSIMSTW